MEYELRNAVTTGGVKSNDDATMTQKINVTVGVKGCTHEDIKTEKTVDYIFSENLTGLQIKDGILTFATQWVTLNYPTTV